jgi:hypothetical protein
MESLFFLIGIAVGAVLTAVVLIQVHSKNFGKVLTDTTPLGNDTVYHVDHVKGEVVFLSRFIPSKDKREYWIIYKDQFLEAPRPGHNVMRRCMSPKEQKERGLSHENSFKLFIVNPKA